MNPERIVTPETLVTAYYRALRLGDMAALRGMMMPSSYLMTIEAYGLKRTFSDPGFKALLERIETDPAAMQEAEKIVAQMLRQDAKEDVLIADIKRESLGEDRCAVRYTEAGNPKKLSFSNTETGWKIDYYAGRKRT